MVKWIFAISLLVFFKITRAEVYYCWSVSGLNIRETPAINGTILGKMGYGESIEIDMVHQEYSLYHEELFLLGDKQDKSADIKFKGSWLKVEFNGINGYVFSGYLSRFPAFMLHKNQDNIECEKFRDYMSRNFKLLNHDKEEWHSSPHFDNQLRYYFWDQGIMVIEDNNDKGPSAQLVFADMTINETLLFVKFYFSIINDKRPSDRSELISYENYYGQLVAEDKYVINFPAPDGTITIFIAAQSIIISYSGGC